MGASGRMGQEISSLLAPGFSLQGALLELADAVSGSGKLKSLDGVPVRTLQDPPWQDAHVWIDFSRPEGTMRLLEKIEAPVLIGTTGFSTQERAAIERYASKWPVLLAPNTSPGVARMVKMLRAAAFPEVEGFDVVFEEEHHRHKKDAPSGTAKMLIAVLEGMGARDIQVQVTRAGGIVGNHRVKWIAEDEEIVLEHRVFNRRVFARGALLGALFLAREKRPGLHVMDEVFEKENHV
jgi:4-hydroxy-tetrahydrodipicolinate reductase